MKCKMCSGAGVIQGQAPGLVSCCPACDGNGFIEQINEEWLRTATTEQLAEWIARRVNESVETALYDNYLHDGKTDWQDYMVRSDDVVKWLKQPHRGDGE